MKLDLNPQHGHSSTSEEASWLTTEPCIAGIDEAGRGPVLGPMTYAIAVTPASREAELKRREFADSKALNEATRNRLMEELEKDALIGFLTLSATAQEISAPMLDVDKQSLNAIANQQTFDLLESLISRGTRLSKVYVDTVGDAGIYRAKLSKRYPEIEFSVCPKADSLYPIVSAASIAAKVTRDRELQGHFAPGTAYGSGYPADPVTKVWLEANLDPVFGYGEVMRFSWAPCVTLLDARGVPVQWQTDEDQGALSAGQQTLQFAKAREWGSAGIRASQGTGRHSFFKTRRLQKVKPRS